MQDQINDELPIKQIGKFFHLKKLIGVGSFGKVYEGFDTNKNQQFAIKLEPIESEFPQIFQECKILQTLEKAYLKQKLECRIPKVIYCSNDSKFNILIMDLLGLNLENQLRKQGDHLQIESIVTLAIQIIDIIEFLHINNYIHRDIKPENFVLGRGQNQDQIYIIDFGISKQYKSNDVHIPYKEGKSLTGTARYASINNHLGIELSRRDDLESIGYMLLYLLKGALPWQSLGGKTKSEKYELIKRCKMQTSLSKLCENVPIEFPRYLNYVKNLRFDANPDYQFLRQTFIGLGIKSLSSMVRFEWSTQQSLQLTIINEESLDNDNKKNSFTMLQDSTNIADSQLFIKENQKKSVSIPIGMDISHETLHMRRDSQLKIDKLSNMEASISSNRIIAID